jgi:hypothetical protein
MTTRKQIVDKAREYLGVPFQHQGRSKQGLDCVGLILAVAEDLQLLDAKGNPVKRDDHIDYGPQPVTHLVLDTIRERMKHKSILDIRAGDVACLKLPEVPTHAAFVGFAYGQLTLIHAYDGGRLVCVEHGIDVKWHRRIVGAFEFPGVED